MFWIEGQRSVTNIQYTIGLQKELGVFSQSCFELMVNVLLLVTLYNMSKLKVNRPNSSFLLFFFAQLLSTVSGSQSIDEKFKEYHELYPNEKVYLHISKPHFRLGETVWFKAYIVDGSSHRPDSKSDVITVDLIDPSGKIMSQRILNKTHNRMDGDFDLDISFEPGAYTIRAYTNWMRNFDHDYFYSSTFHVFRGNGLTIFDRSNNQAKDLDLAFFPEGGDLIGGMESNVGVKSIDRWGKGIEVQGTVVDSSNREVASFKTNALGFAFFTIRPQISQQYKVRVSTSGDDYAFDLPRVLEKGFGLHLQNTFESDSISIHLKSVGVDLKDCSVLLHQRGIIRQSTTIQDNSPSFSMNLSKSELDPGVYHFTVFDPGDQPVAERLFAVNLSNYDPLAKLEKDSTYKSGTDAEAVIRTREAISGSVSLSVTRANGPYYSTDQNIENYLLLGSDLKGHIEKPSGYLKTNRESHESLDLLMLTQGWKRFTWNEVLSDSVKSIEYEADVNGLVYSGRISNFYNRKKASESIVSMSTITSSTSFETKTDGQGRFKFTNLNFPDSIELVFEASRKVNKKGKMKKDTYIKFDKRKSPDIPQIRLSADLSSTTIEDLLKEVDTADFTLLDEVVVSARKETKTVRDPFAKAKTIYLKPSIRIVADSVFKYSVGVKSVAGFLRNVPGLAVIGSGPSAKVRLQGLGKQQRIVATNENMAPLYLIDGVPASEPSIFSLNQFDVSYIDVLRGAEASLYGTRASNGIIAIYLRSAELAKTVPRPGFLLVQFPGYYRAKKFEFTDIMKSNLSKDPLGITVHWNPSIQLRSGAGHFKFNLPDEPGNYFVRLEGLANDGSPLFLEEAILVE